jgi:hypothetical protein
MRPTIKIGLIVIGLFAFELSTSAFASAAELKRLFFTPEQRAQLDYTFSRQAVSENNDRALMLNGIVQKHGGKRTVWINGVPQEAGNSNDKAPESQSVRVPGKPSTVKLKVGQRVLLDPAANPDTTRADTPSTDTQDTSGQ